MAVGQQSHLEAVQEEPSLWQRLGEFSRSPLVGMFLLLAGLGYAAVLAPQHRDEFVILQGGELALIAILRLLVHGHTSWFFRAIMVLGLGIPLVGGLTSPIYWSGGLRAEIFAQTFAIGLIPGLGLLYLGFKGLSLIEVTEKRLRHNVSHLWLRFLKGVTDVALWILVAALMTGVWSDVTVGAVILCSLVLLFSVIGLLSATFSKKTLGKALLLLAGLSIVSAFVIVGTQGRACQEAMVGVPIGMLIGLIGVVLAAGDDK